jgi:hypothetical protein
MLKLAALKIKILIVFDLLMLADWQPAVPEKL